MASEPDQDRIQAAFATVLKRLREGRGMTQEDLGFEAGVGRVSVTMMETGRRLPTLPTLFRLAEALGVSGAELVGAVEAENRS